MSKEIIGIIGHCDPRIHTCIENHIPRGILIVDVVKEQQKVLEKEVFKIENFHIEKYIEPFFDAHKKKPKNQNWQKRIKDLQRRT